MSQYQSTKTFGHEVGLSVAFRQWRAESHCRFLHGYALAVKLTFECDDLDANGWCMDFGALGSLREYLKHIFDHKTVVAEDDPQLENFKFLQHAGIIQLVILPRVGCEAFAEHIYNWVAKHLSDGNKQRVRVDQVEVMEHGANSAIYKGDKK